jgi:hypothetical protein
MAPHTVAEAVINVAAAFIHFSTIARELKT